MRVYLGGHPNTRFSGHGEVKLAPFLLMPTESREEVLPSKQTNKHTILFGRVGRKEGLPQPLPQRTHYSVMGLGGRISSFQPFVRPHLVDYFIFPRKDGKVSTTQEELVVIFLDNHHRWKNRVFCTSPPHTQLHEMPTPPPNTFH